MSTRNLEVHDAERLTQGTFEVLRAPHYASHFESEPWFLLEPVVARNITRDWLCFTVNYDELLEQGTNMSCGFDIDLLGFLAIEAKSYDIPHTCRASTHLPSIVLMGLVRELNGLLEDAVENLSARNKHVYTLRKVHGLSEDEIAGELDLTPDTVNDHLEQAAYQCATGYSTDSRRIDKSFSSQPLTPAADAAPSHDPRVCDTCQKRVRVRNRLRHSCHRSGGIGLVRQILERLK